jgi:hypothetical protein
VPARTRKTINVDEDAGTGYQISTLVKVISGEAVIAERPMYFLFNGAWDGGSDVMGKSPI